jgi:hypothetical protein
LQNFVDKPTKTNTNLAILPANNWTKYYVMYNIDPLVRFLRLFEQLLNLPADGLASRYVSEDSIDRRNLGPVLQNGIEFSLGYCVS